MMSCQHCQPLILDYSYGLLDEPEAVAIESHLRECATCSAVRNQVAQLQGLIARAAKSTFPRVRFDPASIKTSPTTQSKTVAATRSIPAQSTNATVLTSSGSEAQTESRKGVWIAWAIAAAVLFARTEDMEPLAEAVLVGRAVDRAVQVAVLVAHRRMAATTSRHLYKAKEIPCAINGFISIPSGRLTSVDG